MKKIFYLVILLTIVSCNTKTQKGKFAVYVPNAYYMHTFYTNEITFEGNGIVFESISDNKTISIDRNYSIETLY